MKYLVPTATACVLIFGGIADATARSHRVDQIPHGESYGCTSCHVSAAGGGDFTGFGSDAMSFLVGDGHVSMHDVDWQPMASRDSDRDGFTNGEELGDPNGTWSIGEPAPAGRHYNPGDPDDHPLATCGDGRVTPPEECDGENFAGLDCFGLGLDEGTLLCNSDCTFDRSGCGGSPTPDVGIDQPDMGAPEQSPPDDDTACSTSPRQPVTPPPVLLAMLLMGVGANRRTRWSVRG